LSPPIIQNEDGETESLLELAKLMLVAARTAPKSGGKDDVLTSILYGEEKDAIAKKMEEIAETRKIAWIKRDAKNVLDSEVVILIGVKGNKSFGLNCGACGHANCEEFEGTPKKAGEDFVGPACLFKVLDLGIALGSAVKIASIMNADNRIMYSVGTAALGLKLLPEATIIMGIPISAKGKNIYYDREKR
jgi:uncharacterized ferredoxin-like protein